MKILSYRGIPVIVRNDVPDGVVYFVNGEVPPIEFSDFKQEVEGPKVKTRFISKFKARRFAKIKNIE